MKSSLINEIARIEQVIASLQPAAGSASAQTVEEAVAVLQSSIDNLKALSAALDTPAPEPTQPTPETPGTPDPAAVIPQMEVAPPVEEDGATPSA